MELLGPTLPLLLALRRVTQLMQGVDLGTVALLCTYVPASSIQ